MNRGISRRADTYQFLVDTCGLKMLLFLYTLVRMGSGVGRALGGVHADSGSWRLGLNECGAARGQVSPSAHQEHTR